MPTARRRNRIAPHLDSLQDFEVADPGRLTTGVGRRLGCSGLKSGYARGVITAVADLPHERESARRARQELERFRSLLSETRFGDLRHWGATLVMASQWRADTSRRS